MLLDSTTTMPSLVEQATRCSKAAPHTRFRHHLRTGFLQPDARSIAKDARRMEQFRIGSVLQSLRRARHCPTTNSVQLHLWEPSNAPPAHLTSPATGRRRQASSARRCIDCRRASRTETFRSLARLECLAPKMLRTKRTHCVEAAVLPGNAARRPLPQCLFLAKRATTAQKHLQCPSRVLQARTAMQQTWPAQPSACRRLQDGSPTRGVWRQHFALLAQWHHQGASQSVSAASRASIRMPKARHRASRASGAHTATRALRRH